MSCERRLDLRDILVGDAAASVHRASSWRSQKTRGAIVPARSTRQAPVKLTYAELSWIGPVRALNEDSLQFWEPESDQEKRTRGALALLALSLAVRFRGRLLGRRGR